MASLASQPNGHTWVYVKAANGKRRPVRMGAINAIEAYEAKRRLTLIEQAYREQREVDSVTMAWIASQSPVVQDRIIGTGLVTEDPAAPIAEKSIDKLIAEWLTTLDVERGTLVNMDQIFRNLRSYFGASRSVCSIVPADADKFRQWLITSGRHKGDKPLSRATVSKRCRTVKAIFAFAVRLKWIEQSPFDHVRSAGEVNPDKDVYVTPRLAIRLAEISDDDELAAMIILCRFATFRGPSEFRPLDFNHVDWAAEKVRITSPKTKRYPNGSYRIAPLDARSIAALNKLWDKADPGHLVFKRLGALPSSDLSQRLERLCRRVGVPIWDKPWINMRASCETDWQADGASIFETASWMGHSPEVALRHYNRIAKDRVADLVG